MSESDMLKGMAILVFGATFTWIILLLIFREIVCWYFKINELVRLLRSIEGVVSRSQPQHPPMTHSGEES